MSNREAEGRGDAGLALDEGGETFAGGVTFWGGGMDFVLGFFLEGGAAAFSGGAVGGGAGTTLADWGWALAGGEADLGTVWVISGVDDSILVGTAGDFAGDRTVRIGGAADFFWPFFFTAAGLGLDAAGLGLDAVGLGLDAVGLGLDAAGVLAFVASDCTGWGFDSMGLDIGDGGGFPLFW